MTESLTWAEFAEKYQPKDGDKFTDDRGNEWVYKENYFRTTLAWIEVLGAGKVLTCPLIPPKQVRNMWAAIIKDGSNFEVTKEIYDSLQLAKSKWPNLFVSWPAVPNADGSYTVPE